MGKVFEDAVNISATAAVQLLFRSLKGVPRNGSSFAVIFYVHGESFEWNSGNPYDGSVLSSLGRVIVVTINFRLGVLGFLQTGPTRYETHDDPTTVQGNWGLLDVLEALRWVRKNVEAFGGDKDRVTIVGHHTGAALVHLLLVSTAAKGLFQRAAMLSGSAQSLWAVVREPRALRRQVAERLGCLAPTQPHPAFRAPTHTAGPPPAAPQGEDVDVAPCLRRASLRALLASYPPALRFLARFAPATRHDDTGPWLEAPAALHPGPASRTPLLLSVATAEAYAELSAQDVRWGLEEERRDALLRTFVANAYHYHRREILAAVKNEYTEWLGLGADPRARSQRSAKFGDGPPVPPSAPTAAAVAPVARHHLHPITVRDATVEALGDGQTVAPLVAVCREHAGRRGAATYFLHFSHHAKDGVDYAQERLGSAPEEVVAHLFGVPVLGGTTPVLEAYSTEPTELPLNYTKQDVGVAVTMIRYVANFAKSGDPNWESQSERDAAVARGQPWPSGKSDQQHFPPMWMPFDLTSQLYLNMGPKPKMRSHYRSHKMALWLNLIPQLHHSQDEEDMSPHHEFLEKEDQYYAGATLNKSIMDPYWRLGAVWVKSALQSAADPAPMDCDPPEGDPEDDGLNPSSFADPSLPPLNTSATPDADSGPGHSGEIEPGDYFAALSITVTLGVVLLLLNAAVLVAGVVHHNRQKARDSGRRGKGTVKKKPRKAKGKAADEAGSGSERSSGDHHYGVFGDYLDSVPDSKKDYVTDVGTELGLVLPHRAYPDVMDHELCFRKDSSRSLDRCCGGDQQAVRLKKKSQIRSTFGGAAVGSMGALHAPDTSSLSRKKPLSGTATFPRSKPPTGQEAPSPRTPIVKRRVQEISV
ncbi:neuroligin-1-like [Ischnura elegans]|uniref:neuroligin-1-like n=1 Tax=Ischnura elegans TaxID=197161 RepID=UPI001ED8953B|nr:neuroligin-1-like [Ischnura elegans]